MVAEQGVLKQLQHGGVCLLHEGRGQGIPNRVEAGSALESLRGFWERSDGRLSQCSQVPPPQPHHRIKPEQDSSKQRSALREQHVERSTGWNGARGPHRTSVCTDASKSCLGRKGAPWNNAVL